MRLLTQTDYTTLRNQISSLSSLISSKIINGSYTGNDTYPRNVVTSNGKFIIIIGIQTSGNLYGDCYSMVNQGQVSNFQRIGYSGNILTLTESSTEELLNDGYYTYYWYVFS